MAEIIDFGHIVYEYALFDIFEHEEFPEIPAFDDSERR
jgi:hypothetical protein